MGLLHLTIQIATIEVTLMIVNTAKLVYNEHEYSEFTAITNFISSPGRVLI